LTTKQLQYEIDAWMSMLSFIKEENICFKNRLSDVIPLINEKSVLEIAETFQNRFINNDTIIVLLKKDISAHAQLLTKEVNSDHMLTKNIMKKQKTLRDDMEKFENECDMLRSSLNIFTDEIITTSLQA